MQLAELSRGDSPLVVNVPHAGTHVPDAIRLRLSAAARAMPDTDWHVERLYALARSTGTTLMVATHSRYVVDLNRDPAGKPLYPGADNTEVVPLHTFDRLPIYRAGEEPKANELRRRIDVYWKPYHDRVQHELERLKERYGFAILFDAHSIRSQVPRFFEGRLADFNLGTAKGASMEAALASRLLGVCQEASGYSSVLDGRFTGGYITRCYGRPAQGVQAVQLELAQLIYMDEAPPFRFRPELAERIQPILRRVLEELLAWAKARAS